MLPLTDHIIPIIGDDTVIPDFGSGAVKVTPAHDFNDYARGEKNWFNTAEYFYIRCPFKSKCPSAIKG